METSRDQRLRSGDAVLFIDRKQRRYLRTLRAGTRVPVRGGHVECDALIGDQDGRRVTNSSNETFLVLRPTYADLVLHLPRQAQVIYPKDVATILVWGDVFPGATVVEAGVGPGALTIALLRAVGAGGRVISYDCRDDHIAMARRNVARFFGDAPQWTLKPGDVYASIDETGIDRMILDVPEPWRALDVAARALLPGGVLVGYVPTVLQVKSLVDRLDEHPAFGAVETFETLQRFWHVRDLSIRPQHRMVAHTGFLTVARRLAPL
ncbi:MAG: tRNA (adenine-N1)-methyltransferase [Deltaproteobacteria bacterium]|nr:tRNA (adenine-N1)-methyltransferase [Deltaproteobacteria bacterium]